MIDKPLIAESLLWAICDRIKEGDIVFEFGSGLSTKFLLDNSKLGRLYSLEHQRPWCSRVAKLVGEDPRFFSAYFSTENNALSEFYEYSTAHLLPLETADFIILDGPALSECASFASVVAKDGATIFIPDGKSGIAQFACKILDVSEDWIPGEPINTVPEDLYCMEMRSWRRA